MPVYTFLNKDTNEEYTINITLSEREELLKNPNIEQLIVSAPFLGDPARQGVSKIPGSFQSLMRQIKKNNRGSTINTGNLSEI